MKLTVVATSLPFLSMEGQNRAKNPLVGTEEPEEPLIASLAKYGSRFTDFLAVSIYVFFALGILGLLLLLLWNFAYLLITHVGAGPSAPMRGFIAWLGEFWSALMQPGLLWPITVLIFFVIFKRPLTDLLDQIREFKYGDLSATRVTPTQRLPSTWQGSVEGAVQSADSTSADSTSADSTSADSTSADSTSADSTSATSKDITEEAP